AGRVSYALAIDPRTSSSLYAGTSSGVFQSTDGGSSWTAVNTGLTDLFVLALAIDPLTPTTLYAGTFGGGAFHSTDGGGTSSAVARRSSPPGVLARRGSPPPLTACLSAPWRLSPSRPPLSTSGRAVASLRARMGAGAGRRSMPA